MDFVLSSPKCTLSLLSTNQSTRVEKSLFRCSSIVFIFLYWKTRQVSLIYNKSSLSTFVTCWHKLKRGVDPKLNLAVLHMLRYYVYHLTVSSVKPKKSIFLIKMLWSIVLNTFCKSIRTIPVRRPKLKPFVILSWRYDKQVSVEWNFLKPDWYLYRALLSDRKFIAWSWIIRSIILEISGSSEMGLKFFGSVLRPFIIQRLNLCNFTFIWERGEFDGKITNLSYRCTKYIWTIFKEPPH